MPTIDVAALGTARKLLGFSRRTVPFEEGTVADLLRSLDTLDGGNLYACLTCEGRLRGDFAVLVDGLSLKPDQLDRPLQGGEQVVTMAILRHLHGG
ncbi:MAG TPA: MoaD/ThiS family protein [Terriglobales bacterium]|nr:MoaD/ThiS family protein [Terriglobales bacterium]